MAHWYSNPGHDYLILTDKEQAAIPDYAKMQRYEEDCDWAIAVAFNPSVAKSRGFISSMADKNPDNHVRDAYQTLKGWYPDLYWRLTGEFPEKWDNVLACEYKKLVSEAIGARQSWRTYNFINPHLAFEVMHQWLGAMRNAFPEETLAVLGKIGKEVNERERVSIEAKQLIDEYLTA